VKKSNFKEATKDLKLNDTVCISLLGNYGKYTVTGPLVKLTEDQIGISEGAWHSYRRVISIRRLWEETEKQDGDVWITEEDRKKHEEWIKKSKPQ
jgi:hypothetical protein